MRGQVEFDGQSIPFDFVESRSRVSLLVEGCRKLSAAEGPLGVDTETTGLNPVVNQVRLIQVASRDYVLLVDLDGFRRGSRVVDWSEPGLRELKALLESSKLKVLQNASFDLNFLFCEGVLLGGHLFDTMIAAKIYNNGTGAKNDLGMITSRELGLVLPKELQKVSWAGDISPEMVEYAVRDALVLTRLVEPLKAKLVSAEVKHGVTLWNVFELEMRAVRPISRMQVNGFGFDITRARELHRSLQKEADLACNHFLDELDAAIRRRNPDDPECWLPRDPDGSFNVRTKDEGSIRAGTKRYKGFNPRSVQQMALRFKQAGILMPPGATGKDSLDQNILAFIRKEYPLVDSYMTFKTAATRVSACETLLKNYNEATGRIHGNYRQLGTETGRLSASEPNLQQIPRTADFRGCFVAREGYKLLVVDFSQIELRVAGELSGEQRMLDAYLAGRDLHTETAALMAGIDQSEVTKSQRQSAKICNFGLLYGAGAATLRKQSVTQYGIDITLDEARELVNNFRNAYPTLYEWQTQEGNMDLGMVLTKYGRRRFLVGHNDKYTTKINTQVQGTAGDITKIAMVLLWEKITKSPRGDAFLIACVHDELVMEVREHLAEQWLTTLRECMEGAGGMLCRKLPIVAEGSMGTTWAEAK
jgi:DNA polymerase I-like protein with 3'-5' exonuclease and polymerase domains